jgi:hypothetical protein
MHESSGRPSSREVKQQILTTRLEALRRLAWQAMEQGNVAKATKHHAQAALVEQKLRILSVELS